MLILRNINKSFAGPEGRVDVLRDMNFTVNPGQTAVIQGPSGCGKSTLLFTIGAMMPPDKGEVLFDSRSLYAMPPSGRNGFRGAAVGFIFQRFHLIPYLNVEENLLWPLRWSKDPGRFAGRLDDIAGRLGIRGRLKHLPSQLSAGEQQRAAVGRAILGGKKIICADEPTGNLDEENAGLVIQVLKEEASRGSIVILATHQKQLSGIGDINLKFTADGHIINGKANG